MEDVRKVHGTYLDPVKRLFQDGNIPASCGPHGKGSQGLLSICRYRLQHRAITPQDLAAMWHGSLRDNDGQHLGPMTSDLVKVIVGQNRSHFAYVKIMQLESDHSEVEVECVSATMRTHHGHHGHGVHPEYTRHGQPLDTKPGELVTQGQVHRRRPTFAENPNEFPTLPVPQLLPPLPDEVMVLKFMQLHAKSVIACTSTCLLQLEMYQICLLLLCPLKAHETHSNP
jgi:hypothetical protein